MITQICTLFEGTIAAGARRCDFRSAVRERLVPLWSQVSRRNSDVNVSFGLSRDEGAPEFPLVLAITYPDEATMSAALESDARFQSKAVTGEIVDAFFDGRIHHHVTESSTSYSPDHAQIDLATETKISCKTVWL